MSTDLIRSPRIGLLACVLAVLLSGCASIRGYPVDPENSAAALKRLLPYFNGTEAAAYDELPVGSKVRTEKRNEIVFARMRAYDIEFSNFERELYGSSNSVSIGTDLAGLALGGLTATVGGASTKAALGAASVGILGTNTAINKDLYFQKTIPALLAQMQANRAKQRLVILEKLVLPDSRYPLMAAYADLDAYADAGSIPNAISSITQDAGNAKQNAEGKIIAFVRTAANVKQLGDIINVQAQVKKLSDSELLALAKAMQTNLASRPKQIQQLVKQLDPQGARLNGNVVAAKEVLNAWISEEDMTSDNLKEWKDALNAVTKSK